MHNKLIIILVSLMAVGCSTTKKVLVVETKNILIAPPDELMEKCLIEHPPIAKDYVESNWQRKEEMLITFSTNQMKNLFNCNDKLKNLRDWKKKQLDLYSKKQESK